MDLDWATKEIERLGELEKTGEMDTVLIGARKLLKEYPENISIRSNAAALIIDAGNYLEDLDALDQGIEIFEQLLDNESEEDNKSRLRIKYNLSNGYSGKSEILRRMDRREESIEALISSKDLLQQVLIERSELDTGLASMAITNYANTLDKFDRTVEAIDQYFDCIATTPDQGVAIGNCGIAIKRLIPIFDKHRLKNIFTTWSILSEAAMNRDAVLQFANPMAVKWYKDHLAELEQQISLFFEHGIDTLQEYQEHRKEKHGKPIAEEWLAKINLDRLLLTMNLSPLDSEEECIDDLFFKTLTTQLEEGHRERFSILASALNSIKEEYSTARYLYYVSKDSSAYGRFGAITKYAQALDYAELGLSSGLLKASFRIAADCLDKVGAFINIYFNLKQPDDRVYFSNVWYESLSAKQGLHPIIELTSQDNVFIRALLSLKDDWYLQAFPSGRLRDMRNIATHRVLTLHMFSLEGEDNAESPSWSIDKFRDTAFFMLRLTKAAIMYAVLAMDEEEWKKQNSEDDKGPKPSLEFRLQSGWADNY